MIGSMAALSTGSAKEGITREIESSNIDTEFSVGAIVKCVSQDEDVMLGEVGTRCALYYFH